MKMQDKYEAFKEWFLNNGGLLRDLYFPARIGQTKHIGVTASRDIPRNKVIMAIPKSLIISVSTVKQSELREIIKHHKIFSDDQEEETDFNMLALFLIMEDMKGEKSFYAPYLRCLGTPETIMSWHNHQIQTLKDPYVSVSYALAQRQELEPIYKQFEKIIKNHKDIFPNQFNRDIFQRNYGHVMTRCFGWGLPETMIVPFADFLNHDSYGVYHYTFSPTLQFSQHPTYIKKHSELDLSLFPTFKEAKHASGCRLDERQIFILSHRDIIFNSCVQERKISQELYITPQVLVQNILQRRPLSAEQMNHCLGLIRRHLLSSSLGDCLYESTDSEDNDSQEELSDLPPIESIPRSMKKLLSKRIEWVQLKKEAAGGKEARFDEPCPQANKEFEDGVDFSWWDPTPDSHFIVSANRPIAQGQEVCNSYGRRTNRFLLSWYGFTLPFNKYDSVPFRIWTPEVASQTNTHVFVRHPVDDDYNHGVSVGNRKFSFLALSAEFRLKKQRLCLDLITFLRWNILTLNKSMADPKKPIINIEKETQAIELTFNSKKQVFNTEKQVLDSYRMYLRHLTEAFHTKQIRNWKETPSWRTLFGTFLVNSTADILDTHMTQIDRLINIVQQISKQPSHQHLMSLWRELPFDSKMFNREYLRLLESQIKQKNQS